MSQQKITQIAQVSLHPDFSNPQTAALWEGALREAGYTIHPMPTPSNDTP